MMMPVFFVIGTITGILLGLRFKVFVLGPATLIAAAVIVASGHQSNLATALTVLGTVVLLQIGYLVGCILPALVRSHLHGRTMEPVDRSSFNLNCKAPVAEVRARRPKNSVPSAGP
jgi:hypothetical protein